MKLKYAHNLGLLMIFSVSIVHAEKQYPLDPAYASNKQAMAEATAYEKAHQNDATPDSSISWQDMPSGTKCGDYVMSGGRAQVQVNCQGHNPRYSCPTGFTKQNFGYFEAGGGDRMYMWCSKN